MVKGPVRTGVGSDWSGDARSGLRTSVRVEPETGTGDAPVGREGPKTWDGGGGTIPVTASLRACVIDPTVGVGGAWWGRARFIGAGGGMVGTESGLRGMGRFPRICDGAGMGAGGRPL